jgi:hypothetical protein
MLCEKETKNKYKCQKGPPIEIVSRDGNGAMTLALKAEGDALVEGSRKCGPRTIGLEGFHGLLPSKGNGIKL